jgi:hypothetical protein
VEGSQRFSRPALRWLVDPADGHRRRQGPLARRLPASPKGRGLFLFSVGFAFGAGYVDRSYIRRKFRVIHALDRLTDEIASCDGDYQ